MKDIRKQICDIVSEMLDNPGECGIYPTTKCYDQLEALVAKSLASECVSHLWEPVAWFGGGRYRDRCVKCNETREIELVQVVAEEPKKERLMAPAIVEIKNSVWETSLQLFDDKEEAEDNCGDELRSWPAKLDILTKEDFQQAIEKYRKDIKKVSLMELDTLDLLCLLQSLFKHLPTRLGKYIVKE